MAPGAESTVAIPQASRRAPCLRHVSVRSEATVNYGRCADKRPPLHSSPNYLLVCTVSGWLSTQLPVCAAKANTASMCRVWVPSLVQNRADRDRRESRKSRSRSPRKRRSRSRSRSPRRRRSRSRDRRSSRDDRRRRSRSRSPPRARYSRSRRSRSRSGSPGPPPRAVELTDEEKDARTVMVQQLPRRVNKEDLCSRHLIKHFESAGPVQQCFMIADRNSRRSKGIAYIEFAQAESVQKVREHCRCCACLVFLAGLHMQTRLCIPCFAVGVDKLSMRAPCNTGSCRC